MREWFVRLIDWFRRERLDAELREELQFHAAQLARDAAPQRLGDTIRIREAARERWSWPGLEHFLLDTRYALRGLRRSPAFTLTAILALALGIGVNAAMFGLLDRLMFRPHPYLREPSQVNRVYLQYTFQGEIILNSGGFEYARYLDLARWSTAFSQLAGFTARTLAVGTGPDATERPVAIVSGAFFGFFDAQPVTGRFFTPAEDTPPTGTAVVVLAYDYWQDRFGGQDVLGQTLRIQDLQCEIIGVAPPGFIGVAESNTPDLFIPMTSYAGAQSNNDNRRTYDTRYNWGWMSILARRSSGVTEEQASADLTAAYRRSWNAERELSSGLPPVETAQPTAIAGPVKVAAGPAAGPESRTLVWVAGVALAVLLIACANVINLLLARAVVRRRETAVRLALGVSRARVVVQGGTEGVVLAFMGGAVGLLIAQWGGVAVSRLFPQAGSLGVLTDRRTLVAAAGVTLLAGMATGATATFAARRRNLIGDLQTGVRDGGSAFHRSRFRAGLLLVQTALSVSLLIGAGLFLRSLDHVRTLRLGYDADRVLLVTPHLRGPALRPDQLAALGGRLIARAQAFPGVEAAAFTYGFPFWSFNSTYLGVPGIDSVRRLGRFNYQIVTPSYFPTMGTRILRGRALEETDRAGGPLVAVVSDAMGRALWPDQDPIGQCMHVRADTLPCTTVVGVVENTYQRSLNEEKPYQYYLPFAQVDALPEAMLLRFDGDPSVVAEAARAALQEEMPGDGYLTARPFESLLSDEQRAWRLGATLFVAFGGLALLVAAVGLYGVVAYSVAQRMHELGIRSALGARSVDLVRLVVGQAVRLTALGVAAGIGIALVAARWIQPLLFRQPAADPRIYAVIAGLLLAVAVLASALPAFRATRADPGAVLRTD